MFELIGSYLKTYRNSSNMPEGGLHYYPGGSLDADNARGADAVRLCGGASDLDRYVKNDKEREKYEDWCSSNH